MRKEHYKSQFNGIASNAPSSNPFEKYSETCWLCRSKTVKSIVENWDPLINYFTTNLIRTILSGFRDKTVTFGQYCPRYPDNIFSKIEQYESNFETILVASRKILSGLNK